jgi:hypothetical protein
MKQKFTIDKFCLNNSLGKGGKSSQLFYVK